MFQNNRPNFDKCMNLTGIKFGCYEDFVYIMDHTEMRKKSSDTTLDCVHERNFITDFQIFHINSGIVDFPSFYEFNSRRLVT